MTNRVRKFFESVVYAGLKPGQPQAVPKQSRLGAVARAFDGFLSGGAAHDPLYLSNRTFGKKLRSWALVGVPLMLVGGGIYFAIAVLRPIETPPQTLTPGEIAVKMLPNLPKDITLPTNQEVEVLEASVERTPSQHISGKYRNKSAHMVHSGEIIFDLALVTGMQVGAVKVPLKDVPAGAIQKFDAPIHQKDARYVLVREIRTGQ